MFPKGSMYPYSPEGPSTQIVGFQSPKPFKVWILGPKTLLFGYSDPLGSRYLGLEEAPVEVLKLLKAYECTI